MLALLVCVALLGVYGTAKVQGRLEEIAFINNPETDLVMEMAAAIDDQMIALRNIVLP